MNQKSGEEMEGDEAEIALFCFFVTLVSENCGQDSQDEIEVSYIVYVSLYVSPTIISAN